MRKILIMVLIVILLAALGLMLVKGLNIGKFRINSVEDIINDNKNLDEEIAQLSYMIDNDYETAKKSLQESFQGLMKSKQDYQDAITFSSAEEIKAAKQTEKYKLDYLWTKIGLYATKNNLEMQMNVTYGSSGVSGQYDISFTATGEYISISEFIYAIENDSNLGFKIEEFEMVPYSGTITDENGNTVSQDLLRATFVIKNVSIDQNSITSVQPSTTTSSGTAPTSADGSASSSSETNDGTAQTGSTTDGQ